MTIQAVWAQSAVKVALRPTTSHRDAAEALLKVAEIHPSAIAEHIASLRRQIALLEGYLPKESRP